MVSATFNGREPAGAWAPSPAPASKDLYLQLATSSTPGSTRCYLRPEVAAI